VDAPFWVTKIAAALLVAFVAWATLKTPARAEPKLASPR
jgi:hypothetical protein